MALPLGHAVLASGLVPARDRLTLAFLAVLSVVPDFDFFPVAFFGMPMHDFHRNWTHSLLFAVLLALVWTRIRPGRLSHISGWMVFVVLISHDALDFLCTQDAADHGVAWLWPFDSTRYGLPVLVPLYLQVAESPFTWSGAVRFTLLECLLAAPFWAVGRTLFRSFTYLKGLVELGVRRWLSGSRAAESPSEPV